jgi:hypothetical protein
VPALSSSFAPWDCNAKLTGPVCTGERHLSDDWAPIPDVCDVPIWGSRVEHRYQTRYYDHDYLNYYREFRTNDVDYLSTSPTGPATASITTNVRIFETFDVLGEDQTLTITTKGVLWDLRSSQGSAVLRAVGTLVEPYDATPTFSGQVTIEGESTRYDDEPLETFLTDEFFVEAFVRSSNGWRLIVVDELGRCRHFATSTYQSHRRPGTGAWSSIRIVLHLVSRHRCHRRATEPMTRAISPGHRVLTACFATRGVTGFKSRQLHYRLGLVGETFLLIPARTFAIPRPHSTPPGSLEIHTVRARRIRAGSRRNVGIAAFLRSLRVR